MLQGATIVIPNHILQVAIYASIFFFFTDWHVRADKKGIMFNKEFCFRM
jgi:hypothetical protein